MKLLKGEFKMSKLKAIRLRNRSVENLCHLSFVKSKLKRLVHKIRFQGSDFWWFQKSDSVNTIKMTF